MKEAKIFINGKELTGGQSMTVRMAVTLFIMDLNEQSESAIRNSYLERANEILALLQG